jgi:AP-4 complex subunit sigma-1
MFNLEKAHFIVQEFLMNGCVLETNKTNLLASIYQIDKLSS